MLRRHDLVRVEPTAWDVMLRCHPALLDLPLVTDWARRGWPVIVRRRMTGDCVDGVPAALPLPPCHGKRRLAFSFPAGAAMAAVPPVLLCDAARTAPTAWQSVLTAVFDIGDVVKITPRVFGALLWEHATRLPYLTATSDLDLLWSISDERTAVLLVERLLELEAQGPVCLDGELELPDGAGVNWRELAHSSDQASQVLVKTMDGVEVRTKAGLFRASVPLS
jgi:phosphoribosyl-dephospho-CoA transferase